MKKTLSRLPRVVRLAALSAVLLALCSKSSPLYAFNDWMDANIFFTMGRSMLGGRVLYRDVFDHKGPVLYLLYGLAGLVGGTDFRGVLVLEIIAMTSFLYTGLRTAELLAGRRLSVWWMALPAAGMAASRAFSHGGSAEELLLPFLAAALFSLVRALHSPGAKPLCAVCVQGLLAGCGLWLKYTVLGFYLAWVVVLAALYLRRGWLTQLGRSVGAYLGGMALATLPWVVYFGVHGALGDWFTAYFYDNLFLYKGEGGGLPALAQHLWWAVRDGLPAALLLAAFLLWALLTRRFAAAGGVAAQPGTAGPRPRRPAPIPLCSADQRRQPAELRHAGRRLLHGSGRAAALQIFLRDEHAAGRPVDRPAGRIEGRCCGLRRGADRRPAR